MKVQVEGNAYYPLVSIVIPAYNASNYLAEAIDSALAQTYKNIEIIVVNDGSKDEGKTRAVAESYGDKIRYFEKENGGSSSALNMGIRNMKGEWFSWLSHDDLYLPGKVQRQVEFLQKLNNKGEVNLRNHVLFTASELIDKDGRVIRSPKQADMNKKHVEIEQFTNNRWLIAGQVQKYSFHGCGCFVHKSVFETTGCFDEKLRLLNDVDLWYRIFEKEYRIHFLPEVFVQGRVHASQVSRSIGFSYHNPEQDQHWRRTYQYLMNNTQFADWEQLMSYYAASAMRKTRWQDGAEAYRLLRERYTEKRIRYWFMEIKNVLLGSVRDCAKRIYIKLNLKRK